MEHKKLLFSAALLLVLGRTCLLQAQEALNATGGEASGSGGSASYSIGQVTYQTHASTNGSVAEGVQQPYEISITTKLEDFKGINLSVSAYPNPTTDYLTLGVNDFEFSSLHFQLYDINGKLLQSKELVGSEIQINMSSYKPSAYFVKVLNNKKTIKEFKIIKK